MLETKQSRIKCSVWSNGAEGFGLNVLGGIVVRKQNFDRGESPILVELNGEYVRINIDKDGFWAGCGHLIKKSLKPWFQERGLKTGDRVWLEIVEPKKRFRLSL
ncbi:MAG: hypothetical protein ABSA48_09595 [Terracidiphilus sp.]|jgi:hypothetical protein